MREWFSTEPHFNNLTYDDYINDGVEYIVPMTAKAIEDEDKQTELLFDSEYIVEEKFDGTRGLLHIYEDCARCFSRRESKKTGWLTENTDSLPHLRDIVLPELSGTIIDGEMFIPGRPFKDVAAIMNCLSSESIQRQREIGWVVFHAFDIIKYKGIDCRKMPLFKRKYFLEKAVHILQDYYAKVSGDKNFSPIKLIKGFTQHQKVIASEELISKVENGGQSQYSELYSALLKNGHTASPCCLDLNPKAYYEYVVASGGEGVMVKPIRGRYYSKRSDSYLKIKKFLTKDVIITDLIPPTIDYTGKNPTPRNWNYWWNSQSGEKLNTEIPADKSKLMSNLSEYTPITRPFYLGWFSNIEYGVIITDDEISNLPKNKKFKIKSMKIDDMNVNVIIVGECGGFNDNLREQIQNNSQEYIGKVMEVKANEIFSDTGKLRHPRFLRFREDKSASMCTWANHFES